MKSTRLEILATVPESTVRIRFGSRMKICLNLHSLFSQPMLPIGLSDVPGEAMVKLYCPKCMDLYTPKSSRYINGNFLAKC